MDYQAMTIDQIKAVMRAEKAALTEDLRAIEAAALAEDVVTRTPPAAAGGEPAAA